MTNRVAALHAKNLKTLSDLRSGGHRVEPQVERASNGKFQVAIRIWHRFTKAEAMHDTSQTLWLQFATARDAQGYIHHVAAA